MLGSRFFCALFGAVTGQTPNTVSPSLMPSSSLGSFVPQVFVVSSEFDVPSPMAAWAAENNLDDSVGNGLCLNLVGKNDTIFVFSGSLDSWLVWFAEMTSSMFKMMSTAATWVASAFLRLSTLVGLIDMFSMSAGALNVLCAKLIRAATSQTGSRVEALLEGKLCQFLHNRWVPRIGDALLGDHCRYRHSSSCVEARHLISLPLLWVFCRFLLCVLSWLFPWDPGLSACSGTSDR